MSKTPYEQWKPFLDNVAWPKGLKVSYEYGPEKVGLVFYKENWASLGLNSLVARAIAEETAEHITAEGTPVYMRFEDA